MSQTNSGRQSRSFLLAAIPAVLSALVSAGCGQEKTIAVLFVAHGEPATFADGMVVGKFWDGTLLGPSGTTLNVPAAEQATIWAAGYEETAGALTYEYGDFNRNGIAHELAMFPLGDVPPFFTWEAYKGMAAAEYQVLGTSPHNEVWTKLVASTTVGAAGVRVDTFLGFMDAQPFVADKIHEISLNPRYQRLVVVPLLLSESTHTQEIRELVETGIAKTGKEFEVIFSEPFFSHPYTRSLHASAVADLAKSLRARIPTTVPDAEIGVVLAAHGDPFQPPYPEFGWKEGDTYSHLRLTEREFGAAIARQLPWTTVTAANEFRPPSIPDSINNLSASGKRHVLVVSAVFPTGCIHSMWDIAQKAIGRPLPARPAESAVGSKVLDDGTTVWFTSLGYGESTAGMDKLRTSLRFQAEVGLVELLEKHRGQLGW